ncbi:MAG: hypothetical protein HYX61_06460 [Gammaproteobacteria bacterium]|jgi:cell division protein FtsL|nr:hypothetical protein [Gammaproteobacteria bacterium]
MSEEKKPKSSFAGYRPRRRVTMGTLFGVITIVLFLSYNAGFLSGKTAVPELQDATEEVKEYVEQLQKENQELKKKIVAVESNYQIQNEAQKNLSNHLKTLQIQNTELSRDMALYQTLAGNRAQSQGVEIKSFQIYTTEEANTYRYLLVLSKQSSPSKYVQGAVTMTIVGKIGQKTIQLPVKYVDSTREDGLGFKFRHLQELAGELSFPDEFVPEAVQFVVSPDNDFPQFQRHYTWLTDNPDIG